MTIQLIMLIVFVVGMLAIALYSMKKATNLKDFYLGGRNIGPWMSSFAYGTTYFSAVIFVGYAGSVGWTYGMGALWCAIGNAVLGSLLAWWVLAKPARRMTNRLDATTMPYFLQKRYDSKGIKLFSALVIFIFLVPYTAGVYQGIGYLFEAAFGIDFIYCMIFMAVMTAVYVFFGGYFATAVTDFFQGIIMLVGVVTMTVFVIKSPQVGGLANGLETLGETSSLFAPFADGQYAGGWDIIWLALLTSLGAWGMPQMVHKFYAIKDNRSVSRATIITTLFALVVAGGAYFVGAFGKAFFQVGVDGMPVINGQSAGLDMIIPSILTSNFIPAWLLGLIVLLVLSASMSTLASLVMTSASALSMDLFKGVLFPKMSSKRVHLVMRILCAVFAFVSLGLALMKSNAIVSLMSFSWGAVAGAFIGPFVWGLFWKGTTKAGAWAGVITGVVLDIFLTKIDVFLGIAPLPQQGSMAGVLAMIGSLIIVPLVSLCTKKLPEEKIRECFED